MTPYPQQAPPGLHALSLVRRHQGCQGSGAQRLHLRSPLFTSLSLSLALSVTKFLSESLSPSVSVCPHLSPDVGSVALDISPDYARGSPSSYPFSLPGDEPEAFSTLLRGYARCMWRGVKRHSMICSRSLSMELGLKYGK